MRRHMALTLAYILAFSLTAYGGKKAVKKSAETVEVAETAESGAGTEKQVKAEFHITPFQAMGKENYGIEVVNCGNVDEDQGYLQLSLQNKNEGKSHVFILLNLEGDDIVLTTSGVSETVEPGQGKQVNLILQKSSTYSLESFGDSAFRFAIQDNSVQNQKGEIDVSHIYPYGENKEVSYIFAPNDNYKPLDNNEIFEAGVTECKQGQFDNENVFFYLRSKTNKWFSTNSEKGSVNGQTRSTTQYFEMGSGQSLLGALTYQDFTIPETGIKELQFNLRAQGVGNLAGGPLLDRTYTVTP